MTHMYESYMTHKAKSIKNESWLITYDWSQIFEKLHYNFDMNIWIHLMQKNFWSQYSSAQKAPT